ncbi:MAG: RICIN domain-containing protein [Neomegalonema sp.]|nr:RICIN domain-containing protein [Neomegalonema sp.]
MLKRIFITVALIAVAASTAANAQYVRFTNHWKPSLQLNIEKGPLAASPTKPNWWSADWILERVDGTYFRIKNRWKGSYIHNQSKRLEIGGIKKGWSSAMWRFEPAGAGRVRIKNRWTGQYLHIERGRLELGSIKQAWHSAMWRPSGVSIAALTGGAKATAKPKKVSSDVYRSSARQCVHAVTGIGFVAKVRWYYPYDLEVRGGNIRVKRGKRPYRTKNVPVWQKSCVKTGYRMVAQVSVVGGKFANATITIATGTVIAIGGAVACVGSAGTACPAVAGSAAALLGGGAAAGLQFLPDAKETFFFGAVRNNMDVWGTVWKPKYKIYR